MGDMSDSEYGEEEHEAEYFGEYEGERNEAGERHGLGKATLRNGDIYEGQYVKGLREGEGTYTYAESGSIYIGRWEKGHAHGAGELKHKNFRYQGGWNESLTQGAGKFIFDLGCESHGEYLPIEKAMEEEEEPMAVNEPKWKFDHLTTITLDEPLPA